MGGDNSYEEKYNQPGRERLGENLLLGRVIFEEVAFEDKHK